MSLDHSHLTTATAALLDVADAHRVEAIREERWITYPRARLSLELLDGLLVKPRTTRMASIAVQMASHPTERRFYGQLLTAIGVPFAPRATVLDLEVQALRNLRRMDVRLLMLDEVHNILAGSAREQRVVLNMLRYLSNELKVSLVCLGISEAREAIGGDVQLARRFEEIVLPRWQGDEEFQSLVVAILRHLPLKLASQISARALRQILQVTDGVSARVFGMFNDLAIDAIVSGAECISDDAIEAWRPMTRATPAFA